MDFRNTVPGEQVFDDNKDTPSHIFSETESPPSYSAPTAEPPSCQNVRWTPARCANYDFFLHIATVTFGTPDLAIYAYDLAKSNSYGVKLPLAVGVVDGMSIAFLCIALGVSLNYLLTDMHQRMASGQVSRKWPTIIDGVLHTCLLGMADTTLSIRSGDSNCPKNRAVGGCTSSRKAMMIAAGVLLILTGVAGQLRWATTIHAAYERKKLAKAAAAREAASSQQNLTWSNEIRSVA